ncbi:MAG: energy-coupling factor transporter ATPase [Chloroflexota bacterium]
MLQVSVKGVLHNWTILSRINMPSTQSGGEQNNINLISQAWIMNDRDITGKTKPTTQPFLLPIKHKNVHEQRNEPLIRIKDLSFRYPQSDRETIADALCGINLNIDSGSYVAVVGANGSGKTTLARHLNGLLLPTKGQVLVAGLDTRQVSDLQQIRSTVAMVFQEPEDQLIATIVEEDVAFGPENLGIARSEIKRRVRDALETVSMWQERNRPPHLLSAGQQQRVAIAGTLAMKPRCLVLDEATSMLDPLGKHQFLDLIGQLHQSGLTIITITHSMREASMAERVIVMDRGRIARDTTPRNLFLHPNHLHAFSLKLPPVPDLIHRIQHQVPDLPEGLLSADQMAQALSSTHPPSSSEEQKTYGHGYVPSPNTPVSTAPLITIRDLSHVYLQGTPIEKQSLSNVNLEINRGEIVAIIGPTGSGKSTLLQHINGLYLPQRGNVIVEGESLNHPETDVAAIRRKVGLVFQKPEDQLFERFVGDEIAYGPLRLRIPLDEVRILAFEAMERAGLDFASYKDRTIASLSGGERRKVALACALIQQPTVLALDEATAGLDPLARDDLLHRIMEWRSQGMTMIISTHNLDDVAVLADRVIVLNQGKLVLNGSKREVLSNIGLLQHVGLVPPPAVQIGDLLRKTGYALNHHTVTIPELADSLLRALGAGNHHE